MFRFLELKGAKKQIKNIFNYSTSKYFFRSLKGKTVEIFINTVDRRHELLIMNFNSTHVRQRTSVLRYFN